MNSIRTAEDSDRSCVLSTIVMAFSADPVARWMYPRSSEYLAYFPHFVKAFGGKAFAHNTAHLTGDGAGAALWLAPEVEPDSGELEALVRRTVRADLQDDFFDLMEQMGQNHPHEPHWYLPMIGVEGIRQGQGYGAALLRHALAVCDRDNLPAYLESSNPRNIPLYRRHGYEVCGEIQSGSSPPLFPMIRQPRGDK